MADAPSFQSNAGHRVLDFVNTLDATGSPEGAVDSLTDYAALLHFAEASALLPDAVFQSLRQRKSNEQNLAYQQALALRNTIRRVFAAVACKRPLAAADLNQLNDSVNAAMCHRHLVKGGAHMPSNVAWGWRDAAAHAVSPLWPIAFEAADLLVSERVQFIRECSSPTCDWLFLDTSKNHSRRWCDMKSCGNRAKARNYYQRVRETGSES